jgi:glycosyltransferase involved in cell wall biosynthesis
MRIALVWNAPARLRDISLRLELYAHGFEALGHEAVTVCSRAAAEGYTCPTIPCDDERALAREEFWRGVGADVALVITWHRMGDVLAALREAGARTINIPDSDGCVGVRAHFWETLERTIRYRPGWLAKANCFRYWVQRYLLGDARYTREVLESTRQSGKVLFAGRHARAAFRRFLDSCGEGRLDNEVRVMPLYPVAERFCELSVPTVRAHRVVAVGRWDDPQKDAGLLAASVECYLSRGGQAEFVVVGRGGEGRFDSLGRRFAQVRYVGPQPQERVAELLRESRFVLFSSRWEGFPHTVNEALALGCTVVGTPIASLLSVCEDGRFGRVSPSRRPSDLADAIRLEMAAWQAGERAAEAIAAHWRAQLRPEAVCARLLREIAGDTEARRQPCTTT